MKNCVCGFRSLHMYICSIDSTLVLSDSPSSHRPKALILFLVSHSTVTNSYKKSNYFICLHIIIWLNFSLNWTNFFFPSIITIVLRDGSYAQTYRHAHTHTPYHAGWNVPWLRRMHVLYTEGGGVVDTEQRSCADDVLWSVCTLRSYIA